ncbi:MAG TPA: NAD-dependent epimerase/dehydratase family protein [Ignavibacteriales bacterium]|nr:NAD-dependent epimerase/dehydratase family protein [Ignavibacteriales bacterium]
MNTKLRVIITGVTGMVGEGVLRECLQSPNVDTVLVIGRRPCGVIHPKLKEIVREDMMDLSSIASQLTGYNACFFCLGISSVGLSPEEYYRTTYTLTLNMARILSGLNPDVTFCYVSGAGTDSSEKGKIRWARVKGKTENDLMKLPFKQVFAFRPGMIKSQKGAKRVKPFYKYVIWAYPIMKTLFPNSACTLEDIGLSMINAAALGYEKNILDNLDIDALAKK